MDIERFDKLGEECGVFGVYDFDGNDVASTIYYGLFALQHRGQESCGIAVSDTNGPKGKVSSRKGMGLCNEVFTQESLGELKGDIGVGHVRYSTAGQSCPENAQPLVLNYVKGTLGLAHNGNLINALELRHELEYSGAIFQTTIDSEVIAYHIARERVNTHSVEDAVAKAIRENPDAVAVVVNNPTYYGVCSDLRAIVKMAHDAGMLCLADEAHGTHFYFGSGLPVSAMAAGADMAAISMHKSGGSLTQSSFLLTGPKVHAGYVRQIINLTQTTSGSYLLMSSLDISRRRLALHGREIFHKVVDMAEYGPAGNQQHRGLLRLRPGTDERGFRLLIFDKHKN